MRRKSVENGQSGEKNSKENGDDEKKSYETDDEPEGLWAKFKYLFKRYWYVAIPVHTVLSAVWFAGFYFMAARLVYY